MHFTKMEGTGNDYIYLEAAAGPWGDLPELARQLSHRHFGVGSDGLILIEPSQRADFSMRMFNADGSEGAMCGNGIRCVGKYVYDKGLTEKTRLSIETRSGVRTLELHVERGRVSRVTVHMGRPVLGEPIQVELAGESLSLYPVSLGNPHAVLFWPGELEPLDLPRLGPQAADMAPLGAEGCNVEFVALQGGEHLKMRVWERGSGETLSCGTGACAAAAAARTWKGCGERLRVELPGGELEVCWPGHGEELTLTGPAVTVFEGEWPIR